MPIGITSVKYWKHHVNVLFRDEQEQSLLILEYHSYFDSIAIGFSHFTCVVCFFTCVVCFFTCVVCFFTCVVCFFCAGESFCASGWSRSNFACSAFRFATTEASIGTAFAPCKTEFVRFCRFSVFSTIILASFLSSMGGPSCSHSSVVRTAPSTT